MNHILSTKRGKIYAALAGLAVIVLTVALVLTHSPFGSQFGKVRADNSYHLTLDTSNRLASNVSGTQKYDRYTAKGNAIEFTYSNCNADSSYHAVINASGSITNTKPLNGVTSFTAVFASNNGQLRVRASYDGEVWGESAALQSGVEFEFGSELFPNYIEISASGSSVSLSSVDYCYECQSSSVTAHYYREVKSSMSDYSGTYLIVDKTSGKALHTVNGTSNTFTPTFINGKVLKDSTTEENKLTITKSDDVYKIQNNSNKYLDYSTSTSDPTLFWDSEYKPSIEFIDGLFSISRSGYYFTYDSANSMFNFGYKTYSNTNRLISLFKFDDGTPVPDYDCGLECTDSRASKYAVGETFANFVGGNGLNVSVVKADGSVSKLTNSEFSYEIKDGNTTISSTTPFTESGVYTVNVSYSDLLKYSYNITVNAEPPVSDDYVLVTSAGDLSIGQSVVITTLDTSSMKAMSTTQNTNNRGATTVSVEEDVLQINENVCEFELQAGTVDDTFAFYDSTNSGYIYAASSDSNHLKTQSSNDANGSFAVEIYSDGEASIVAQGSNTRNVLQYNPNTSHNNPIFSCYASASQEAIAIYAKESAAPAPVLVQSVTLDHETATISESGSITLTATVLPVDASNKEVTWSTSNGSVATVDSNGVVSGLSAGTAIITATAKDGTGFSDSCEVTVQTVAVTGVTIDESLALNVGDQTTLNAVITPTNASDKSVTWSSSDPTVATVSNGTVNALKAGTTTITVTTTDGGFTDTCTVTVSNVAVTGFSITEDSLDLYVGDDDVQLTTVITPNNATDKTVTWTSSNPSVATVSGGLVHAVAEGSATITGTCNNISDTVDVTVHPEGDKPVIQYVDLDFLNGNNSSTCTVNDHPGIKVGTSKLGGTFKLSVPAKTTKLTLYAASWNGVSNLSLNIDGATTDPSSLELSSDTGIANNSPFTTNGNEDNYKFDITLNVTSETLLTFSTSAAKRAVAWRAVATVTTSGSVTPVAVEGVSVSPSTKSLNIGETATLSATVSPSNADNQGVTWSSSSSSVASVDSNGKVTAVAVGTATITAASKENSDIKGTCTVTVTNPTVAVTSIELSVSSKTLTVDDSFTLTATVYPSNATNKNVTWTTSNQNIASVSSAGVVTAVAEGTATITARSVSNTSVTASCTVTVESSGGSQPSGQSGWLTSINVGDTIVMCNTSTEQLSGVTTYGTYTEFSDEPNSSTYPLVVCNGSSSGTYAFKTSSNEYLSWSSGNSLATSSSLDAHSSWTVSINSSSLATILNASDNSRQILWNVSSPRFAAYSGKEVGSSYYGIKLFGCAPAEPVHLSNIYIPETASLAVGKTTTLDVTYNAGFNVEEERGVTWKSSATGVATVDSTSGLITAVAAGTTTITATSTFNTSLKDTCTLTVTEESLDKWTIMIYMCGADLESDSGQASGDIEEILDVNNQPDDVNIIIETGGAKSWKLSSSYIGNATSIPSNKLTRWHVEGNKIYKDAELSNGGMGTSSVYQSFLTWGLDNYPAAKTGVVLWNHGGGLDGVCFDENYSDNPLLNSEMKTAHQNAIGSNNKLEWIGYDACLMQNMEIADFNSSYFNYQVASQESENGSGWYYTGWVDNVYANNATTTILKEIVDTFITTQGTNSDQTLSYLNLSNISTFKTAMENYASALLSKLQSGSVSKSTFASWAKNNIKNYSETGYCGYGQFDVKDWVTKCQNQSSYSVASSYATALTNALSSFIGYNRKGSKAGQSNGVCLTYSCTSAVDYSSSQTGYTNWLAFNNSYGL